MESGKKRSCFHSFWIVAVCLIVWLSFEPASVHGASWSKLMPVGYVPSTGSAIPLKNSNVVVKSKASNIKQIAYNGSTVWCAKIANASKTQSYSNFLTVTFPKTAKIRGREIDITIAFTAMTIGKGQGKNTLLNKDGYAAFARCNSSGRFFLGGIGDSTSRPYKAKKQITTSITAAWSDGGGIVNLPFYQGVSDVDAGMSADYYKEAWEGSSGFSSTFYIWADCRNTISGNKMTASYGDVDGNDSWYKAGLIAPTNGGQFTVKWTEGNCETGFLLYNQYKDMPAPTKTVDRTSAVKGDIITWEVSQKTGIFYRNTFSPYTNFSFADYIPRGVEYQSARVFRGAADITSQGILSYNPDTRYATFTLNSGQLGSAAFYQGQAITMKITARAELPEAAVRTVQNQAAVTVSGYAQDTNPVTTVIQRPDLEISKAAAGSEYKGGDTIPYTVTVKQTTANLSGENIVVTDALPEGLTLKGKPVLSGAEGNVTVKGDTWKAVFPSLAYGQTAVISFSAEAGNVTLEKSVINTVYASMEDAPKKEAASTIRLLPEPLVVEVEKVWEDEDDFYGLRPKSVNVELLRDGKPIQELRLKDSNGWKGTFENLPQYRTENERYDYQVRETDVPTGYNADIKHMENRNGEFERAFRITNSLVYYELTIHKQIAKADYYEYHGNEVFLYQITSENNPNWRWYEEISFTEKAQKQEGAVLTASKTMKLPYGVYEATELETLRYQGEIIRVSANARKIGSLQAEVKLGVDGGSESITYKNKKVLWDRYSHNDLAVNELR